MADPQVPQDRHYQDYLAYRRALEDIRDVQDDTKRTLKKLDDDKDETHSLHQRMKTFIEDLGYSWTAQSHNAAVGQEIYALDDELRTTTQKIYADIDKKRETLTRELREQKDKEEELTRAYELKRIESQK